MNASSKTSAQPPRFFIRPLSAVVVLAGLALGVTAIVVFCFGLTWGDIRGWLRATLGPPLARLHHPLDRFLDGLPMWIAQACAIGLFVAAGIFAWSLPRRFVYLGAPDQARWRDLRIWATLVLAPYVVIYLVLGL